MGEWSGWFFSIQCEYDRKRFILTYPYRQGSLSIFFLQQDDVGIILAVLNDSADKNL
jgi:hypothetical protein